MTDLIDHAVVEMEFRNERFEDGIRQTIGTVDSLQKSLNFDSSISNMAALNAAGNDVDFRGMGDAISSISDKLSLMGIVGITILQDLTREAMHLTTQLGRAVLVRPMLDGFREYEIQMNSIQTILANTESKGTTLDDVTASLDVLNQYADDTIYVFSQMTKSIGTFTAAGVGLETSVAAIKGISNVAAISGSDADQAARAMHSFSRALAEGHVSLLHWRSIVTAGMGGEVFRNALTETARMHGVAIDDYLKKYGGFRATLRKGWLTNDILMETLSKFTGDLTEEQIKAMGYTDDQIAAVMRLGEMSNDAARKIKTFTQLRATLSEALGTGWATTFQTVLGDFEEAKAFYTTVDDLLGSVIQKSSDSRNNLLSGWKSMGGRLMAVDAATKIMEGLYQIIRAITKGLRDVFPKTTAYNLTVLTLKFAQLAAKFKIGDRKLRMLRKTFKGLASAIDIPVMLVKAMASALGRLYDKVKPADGSILDFTSNLADSIIKFHDFLKESDYFNHLFENIGHYIDLASGYISDFLAYLRELPVVGQVYDFIDGMNIERAKEILEEIRIKFSWVGKLGTHLWDIVVGIFNFVKMIIPMFLQLGGSITDAVAGLVDGLSDPFADFDVSTLFSSVNMLLLGKALMSMDTMFGNVAAMLLGFKNVLSEAGDVLQDFQLKLKADSLLKAASAILLLAVALVLISSIDKDRLVGALEAVSVVFLELFGATGAVSKLAQGTNAKQTMKAILLMQGMAFALVVMAAAVRIMGGVPADKIDQALLATAAVILMLVTAVNTINVPRLP